MAVKSKISVLFLSNTWQYSVSVLFVLVLASCGTTKPSQTVIQKKVPAAKAKPIPQIDYASRGRPVALGSWEKIVGFNTIWLKETQVLVTLKTTAWDEIDGTREGRATLVITHQDKPKTIVIREGQTRIVSSLQFELKTAFEEYKEGRYEPMVELRASKK